MKTAYIATNYPSNTDHWRNKEAGGVMPDDVLYEAIEIRVLSQMTENERIVYLYNLIFGRPFKNTAEVLGCSEAYVSKLKKSVLTKIATTAATPSIQK